MKIYLAVAVLGISMILVASSCKKESASEKPTFAFVINQPARFWDLAHSGCQQAAREENVLIDFQVPGQGTAAQQKQIVETLIAKKCNGLAISPLSPESMGRLLDAAAEFMPVITQDSDAPDCKRLCYIGTDNVAAGRAAGEQMKMALPEGGDIAVFVGKRDVANARERYQGVCEALADDKYNIVELFTDQTDRSRAQSNVRTALAKYENLKGIVGLWNYNAPCALMALKDFPDHMIKVVGFDEDIETLEAIRNGKMVCSIAQQPYEFGYQSIKLLHKIHKGEPVDIPDNKLIHVPVVVITPENVDEFEKDVNHKLSLLKTRLKHYSQSPVEAEN